MLSRHSDNRMGLIRRIGFDKLCSWVVSCFIKLKTMQLNLTKPLYYQLLSISGRRLCRSRNYGLIWSSAGRTGSNMLAETTLELAKISNIVAMKEASGNMEQIMAVT